MVFLIVAPPQKLVLASGATIGDNAVFEFVILYGEAVFYGDTALRSQVEGGNDDHSATAAQSHDQQSVLSIGIQILLQNSELNEIEI